MFLFDFEFHLSLLCKKKAVDSQSNVVTHSTRPTLISLDWVHGLANISTPAYWSLYFYFCSGDLVKTFLQRDAASPPSLAARPAEMETESKSLQLLIQFWLNWLHIWTLSCMRQILDIALDHDIGCLNHSQIWRTINDNIIYCNLLYIIFRL